MIPLNEEKAARAKAFRDNREEEREAYRKIFHETGRVSQKPEAGKAGTPTLDPSPSKKRESMGEGPGEGTKY